MLTYEEFLLENPSLDLLPDNEKQDAYNAYCALKTKEAEEAKIAQDKANKEAVEQLRLEEEARIKEEARIAEEARVSKIIERIRIACDWDYSILGTIIPLVTSNLKYDMDKLLLSSDGEDFILLVETQAPIVKAKLAQEKINKESQDFLESTDWKIIRHVSQGFAGIQQSMSQEEIIALETKRQVARDSIKKI